MLIAALATLGFACSLHADIPIVMNIYEGTPPGSRGSSPEDIPTLTTYLPQGVGSGAAFIVCPGGGYGGLAEHEGKPVAEWLSSLGITAFVLKYRLGPVYHAPYIDGDAHRAIRLVRYHSKDWGIDPGRIGIMGFSAGGHLASVAATQFDDGKSGSDLVDAASSRPNAAALIYPVITMTLPWTHIGSRENLLGKNPTLQQVEAYSSETRVTDQTPPIFIAAGFDDSAVPIENSIRFIEACRRRHVSVEAHLFAHGPHGFGLGGQNAVLQQWPKACALWLKGLKFI